MHFDKIRLTLLSLIFCIPATAAEEPATVGEATKVIDLATFPLMPGGVSKVPRRLANLEYSAKGEARGAFAFQKKTLEEKGWKELPGAYLSDQSCSGTFGKNGYKISVSTSPSFGPDAAGLVDIRITNHGNVDNSKLPVPPDAKPLYSFPAVTAYVTEKSVNETSQSLRKLMLAKGWEPYGSAGDSMYFKKNAVKLTAWPSVAPAQGGKTVMQLSTELMSVDMPAPPTVLNAAYADTTKALSLEVDMTRAALATFYKETLGKAGWKATTETPVKSDFRDMLIFRNAAKDLLTLKMHKVGENLRVNLDQQTEAEFNERLRLAAEQDAKRKADAAQYAMKAAEKAAKDRVTIAIIAPVGAKEVARTKESLEYKLDAGKAKAAVQSMREKLLSEGWTGTAKALDNFGGSVSLSKKPNMKLTIVYVDAGFGDASISIIAIGADIDGPASK